MVIDGTHVPVLRERCLELLAPALARSGAVYLDATLGLGGHSEAVLSAHPKVTLIGLDRDREAVARAAKRLDRFADRIHLVHATYDQIPEILDQLGFSFIDGILFDLGVSSMQLDHVDRGFSYARDAPLDMRMDQSSGVTAADVINTYSVSDLTRILRVYGEERFARRIAHALVRHREMRPINTSIQLASCVRDAIPAPARRTGGNPAKRTFQAIRIEVNGELSLLERALPAALDALRPGGRLVSLAYHSLEDRIVKRALVARTRSSAPPELPIVPKGSEPSFVMITRKSEAPSEGEIGSNPRSASARLRAAERIAVP